MHATVIVHECIESLHGASAAQDFCAAWLAAGHDLAAVVFHHDASTLLAAAVEDTVDQRLRRWYQMSARHGFPLLVCAAAASRRGVSVEPVSALSVGRLLPVGLATILDAVDRSDRTLTFSA